MRVAFVTTALLILTFLSWVWLAPTTVRGNVTYAIVSGASMEPAIHRGDLAVLRRADSLRVGEVAAYHSTAGRHVLHRVVAQEDAGYVFQGDSNYWQDSDRPTDREVVGKLWFQVPRLGWTMRWMQSPAHAALIAGGVVAMTAGGMLQPPRRKWPRRLFHRPDDSRFTKLLLAAAGSPGRVFVGVMLAFVAVALTVVCGAFLVSPFRSVTAGGRYEHRGEFSYSARSVVPTAEQMAPLHVTREDAEQMAARLQDPRFRTFVEVPVTTGQPLLSMVNPTFDISFRYSFDAGVVSSVTGTVGMAGVVRDVTGWSRTFPLAPRADFAGDQIEVTVSNLSLQSFMSTIHLYEVVTGHTPRYYTAALVVDLEVHGMVDGAPFTDRFQPKMVMRIIPPAEVFPETEETRAFELPGGAAGEGITLDPFQPRKRGEVTYSTWEPRIVTMLGVSADVHTLRWASLSVLAAALTAIGGVVWLMHLAGQRGEAFAIRARYGPSLVLVDPAGVGHAQTPTIKVSTMEDLVRLAHHTGGPVLVELRAGRQVYLVREGEHFYAYVGEAERPHASHDQQP